jgi:hypothetical protein
MKADWQKGAGADERAKGLTSPADLFYSGAIRAVTEVSTNRMAKSQSHLRIGRSLPAPGPGISRPRLFAGLKNFLLRAAAFLSVFAGLFCIQSCAAAMKVMEAEAKHSAIEKPPPTISSLARQMKISGRIELEVTIGVTGVVEVVKPLAGNPLLVESGVAAVRKWKFKPFLDSGSATIAITTLTFEFRQ